MDGVMDELTAYDKRLLRKLRSALLVTEAQMSDEQVLKITKGTLMEVGARVDIFKEDLAVCFRPLLDAILSIVLWITRKVQR